MKLKKRRKVNQKSSKMFQLQSQRILPRNDQRSLHIYDIKHHPIIKILIIVRIILYYKSQNHRTCYYYKKSKIAKILTNMSRKSGKNIFIAVVSILLLSSLIVKTQARLDEHLSRDVFKGVHPSRNLQDTNKAASIHSNEEKISGSLESLKEIREEIDLEV